MRLCFKSSIAKILIIMLFLKIMMIVDFGDYFIPQFFLASFRPFPKLSLHTYGPLASHQCAEAHGLKIAALSNSPIILTSYTIQSRC
jgi:hypothetical protein